jgi:hypothetical protein
MRDFDFLDVVLSLLIVAGLCAAALMTGCADDSADFDSDVAVVVDGAPALPDSAPVPDAAPVCLPAYVNDAGITIDPRCADSYQRCLDGACVPCGHEGEPCCAAGTHLWCGETSCVAGVCQ